MGKYRIGFDLTILWSIDDRNGAALPLTDKEVHLYYTTERGRFEAEIEIHDGNVVVWQFPANKQRILGGYTLTLEILQSQGKRAIRKDICDAFELVSRDCAEMEEDEANISEGGEITLASELDIYRISPIIPQIGENGNWFVDGVDTGQPARGEAGSAVNTAYVSFNINGLMELEMNYSYGDEGLPEFALDEDGYLNLEQ